jgi:hypothetical protein
MDKPNGNDAGWPRVYGTARVADNARCLLVSLEREPTDDELRAFDDAIKAVTPQPIKGDAAGKEYVFQWPRQIGRTSAQLAALTAALQTYPSRNTHQLQARKVCAGVARLAAQLLAERATEASHG